MFADTFVSIFIHFNLREKIFEQERKKKKISTKKSILRWKLNEEKPLQQVMNVFVLPLQGM